jgi:LmbE family N-acetylglucosaminyl deacetylase
MSHPYQAFVDGFVQTLQQGRALPLGGFEVAPQPALEAGAPVTLVFSPHPDDESIIGALPLRLRREVGHRVVVVAVTQGSKIDRQSERLEEQRAACEFLGFEVLSAAAGGLNGISPAFRQADPAAWADRVAIIAQILRTHRPSVVVMPHEGDGHPTHAGTHLVVMDALRQLGPELSCGVVLTEFWAALPIPNCMVESSSTDVADLVAAISFHRGEVTRNPYHVLLPSWMSDNVRRGSELVGTHGGSAQSFTFATLYEVADWDGQVLTASPKQCLSATTSPASLFA